MTRRIWKEGDKSRALCPTCERRTDVVFRRRAVEQEVPAVKVPDVLVAVCRECDSIALIPSQSASEIAAAIRKVLEEPPRQEGDQSRHITLPPSQGGNVFWDLGFPPEEAERLALYVDLKVALTRLLRRRVARALLDRLYEGAERTVVDSMDSSALGSLETEEAILEAATHLTRRRATSEGVRRWQAEIDAMFARMQTPEFAAAVRKMLDEPIRVRVPEHLLRDQDLPISVDPEICGGMPVFSGTRVPVDTLLAHIDSGKSIDEYLLDYDVARWKVEALLALPREANER